MALRDAIKQIHDRAEHHPLAQSMINGHVTVEAYADLLANLIVVYGELESKARSTRCITEDKLAALPRFQAMVEDLNELEVEHNFKTHVDVDLLTEYGDSIWKLTQKGTMAHLYVHHMGDMFGGQMLRDKLPGKCRRYDFEGRENLIKEIRMNLTEDMAEEAIAAFEFVLRLYDNVARKHNI